MERGVARIRSKTGHRAIDHPAGIVIIGAGPAGLTAAYQLVKLGNSGVLLETDETVGGLSRTVVRDGWRFDIGGHRFYTKVDAVAAIWHELLRDDEFLVRSRRSRILYNGKLVPYPLRIVSALKSLGPREALTCVSSYAWARLCPPRDQSNSSRQATQDTITPESHVEKIVVLYRALWG